MLVFDSNKIKLMKTLIRFIHVFEELIVRKKQTNHKAIFQFSPNVNYSQLITTITNGEMTIAKV